MINQQHFKPPARSSNASVYTPIKQVFPPVVHTPQTPPKYTKLGENIALHPGDQIDNNIARHVKELNMSFAIGQLNRLNLHNPKWVVKRNTDFDKLTFLDLYLTQGFKNIIDECIFARDSAGATICFNIKAFKVGNYLLNWDNQSEQVYSILDVFSVNVVTQEEVKRIFGGHSRYLEFMSLKGHEAC